mmetsp:Transcript_15529/g.32053  ORF Transcript_15529/g.32053 Transcript_15529/m.32053 type:complete len:90 (-) Transcript_15529:62-331(-)
MPRKQQQQQRRQNNDGDPINCTTTTIVGTSDAAVAAAPTNVWNTASQQLTLLPFRTSLSDTAAGASAVPKVPNILALPNDAAATRGNKS